MGGAEMTKVYAAEFDGCRIDGPNVWVWLLPPSGTEKKVEPK